MYAEENWIQGARRARSLLGIGMQRDPDVVRRQFGMLRNDIALGTRSSFYQTLEVDVNPPWSRVLGEPRIRGPG